jgi:hypothetical protein
MTLRLSHHGGGVDPRNLVAHDPVRVRAGPSGVTSEQGREFTREKRPA